MHSRKYFSSIILIAVLIVIDIFPRSGQAKSLYVAMHVNSSVKAYKIQGSNVQYQTSAYYRDAIGLALDPDSWTIFTTAEWSKNINLLNAKTMVFEETPITIDGTSSLSGIVFDQNKQKLYVVDRTTQHLFVYLWNNELKALFPESESYVLLSEVLGGAWGIDIDKQKGELYVTNSTNTVHRYDTNSWEHKGSIPIVVNSIARSAVGIAIDSQRRYMYTGSFTGIEGSHYYLVRTNINDPNNPTSSEMNVGAYVTGLAMDEETGYLYVGTTTSDYSTMDIRVYNTLTWPSEPCDVETYGVSGPAGMCLGGNVTYKPPVFHLEKVDINEPNSVLPDSNITYRITYGPNGVSQDNVVITDILPGEVNCINPSDPNYNAENHTYTWTIGHLNANAPNNFVTLTVKVNYGAAPNSVIVNYCEIESDGNYKTAVAYTDVGFWQPYSNIIYVDYFSPCYPGTGISWQYAYTDLQDALDRAADGNSHQIWVAGGTYFPSVADPCDPEGPLTFKIIDGVPLYGHFAGNEESISQRNLTNPNTQSIISKEDGYIVNIVTASNLNQETTFDGFTITGNSTLIWIEDTELTIKNCLLSGRGSAYQSGIHAVNSDFTVADCTIQNLLGDSENGIYTEDSNFTITDCNIHNNSVGINVGSSLSGSQIINNIIHNNIVDGINIDADSLLIANNWIYRNNGDGVDTDSSVTFRNNTIFGNEGCGINDDGAWPSAPTIHNCIIWNNTPDLKYIQVENYYHPTYSSFTNYDVAINGTGNIYGDANNPRFVDADSNNFHLDPNSPCIDKGDPNGNYDNQTDIDGESRVIYGKTATRIDMGADEFYRSKADYDHNDIVNFKDYAIWVNYWLTNDPNGRLDGDDDVDISDLSVFCDDWMLIAPWSPLYESLGFGDMGFMSQSSTESPILVEETASEVAAAYESTESISQPMSDEQIEELIDWTEQLWESNPELMEIAGQSGYDLIMESLKVQLDE